MLIVYLPVTGGFVNLGNMTDVQILGEGKTLAIRVFWSYAIEPAEPARNDYYGPDAQAILDALEAEAERVRRSYQ